MILQAISNALEKSNISHYHVPESTDVDDYNYPHIRIYNMHAGHILAAVIQQDHSDLTSIILLDYSLRSEYDMDPIPKTKYNAEDPQLFERLIQEPIA